MSNFITVTEAAKRDFFGGMNASTIRRLCKLRRIDCKNVGTKKKPWYLIDISSTQNETNEKTIEGKENEKAEV